jgi:hypothetical protein
MNSQNNIFKVKENLHEKHDNPSLAILHRRKYCPRNMKRPNQLPTCEEQFSDLLHKH